MDIKLLMPEHGDAIINYEKQVLKNQGLSEIEAEMKSWDFPWRRESLDHYIKLGWSFVALEGEEIKGYILGQPLLFFNNWTQCLWLEYVSFGQDDV
ncbi:MAG: hypothetical protein MJK18_07260 [Bdellovibrionales bacterium]|nr:hypothetical protein [Bdellovibrionales bacterium]